MRLVEMCQWQQSKGIARGSEASGWFNGQQVCECGCGFVVFGCMSV